MAAKEDLRKQYAECKDISQEKRPVIEKFLDDEAYKDYEVKKTLWTCVSQIQDDINVLMIHSDGRIAWVDVEGIPFKVQGNSDVEITRTGGSIFKGLGGYVKGFDSNLLQDYWTRCSGMIQMLCVTCVVVEVLRNRQIPGTDGFTFGFYRHFWSTIENDVFEAFDFKYFFHTVVKSDGICNSMFIALYPKEIRLPTMVLGDIVLRSLENQERFSVDVYSATVIDAICFCYLTRYELGFKSESRKLARENIDMVECGFTVDVSSYEEWYTWLVSARLQAKSLSGR
ncbi:hypothetical protein Tco_1245748 [Tanacetum coccineum]